jgi:hypothetical protein
MGDPEPAADPTRVMLRRSIGYLIDLTLVATGMFLVLWVTGDVEKVSNCDTIRSHCGRPSSRRATVASVTTSPARTSWGVTRSASR